MAITYKNSADEITVGQAMKLHKEGMAVIINDGADVAFQIDEVE